MNIFLANEENIRLHRRSFDTTHGTIEILSIPLAQLLEMLDCYGFAITAITGIHSCQDVEVAV